MYFFLYWVLYVMCICELIFEVFVFICSFSVKQSNSSHTIVLYCHLSSCCTTNRNHFPNSPIIRLLFKLHFESFFQFGNRDIKRYTT